MDMTIVERAVTSLQQQGEAVTVRSVHRLVGESFRDVTKHLKVLFPAGALDDPDAPPASAIAAARAALEEAKADSRHAALQAALQDATARLQALTAAPAPRLTQPASGDAALAYASLTQARAQERAELTATIAQLEAAVRQTDLHERRVRDRLFDATQRLNIVQHSLREAAKTVDELAPEYKRLTGHVWQPPAEGDAG